MLVANSCCSVLAAWNQTLLPVLFAVNSVSFWVAANSAASPLLPSRFFFLALLWPNSAASPPEHDFAVLFKLYNLLPPFLISHCQERSNIHIPWRNPPSFFFFKGRWWKMERKSIKDTPQWWKEDFDLKLEFLLDFNGQPWRIGHHLKNHVWLWPCNITHGERSCKQK